MSRVAVTCLQLIRDLPRYEPMLTDAGLTVTTPRIEGQQLVGEALITALEGCVGVVAGDDVFSDDVLSALPELRVISKWGVGIDGIDIEAARARGIAVTNTPGMFDDEVADVTMAYITMLARRLVDIDRAIRGGDWYKPIGRSLRGRTLAIVGLGGIGRAVARRAVTAGLRVLGVDPDEASRAAGAQLGVEVREFTEAVRSCDVLALCCPLTEHTFHLLDADALAQAPRGVLVVNTARGALIDTDALVSVMRSGHVAGAALDVLEPEPVPSGHPLLELPNLVLGSHNASNTAEACERVHELAIGNLVRELRRRARE